MLIAYHNANRRRELKCEVCGKTLTRLPIWQGLKWTNKVIAFSNAHAKCEAELKNMTATITPAGRKALELAKAK